MAEVDRKPMACSFCGRDEHQVTKLIAGPSVFICDTCVTLCVEILDKETRSAQT
ncbi:MAG TPA: ClpX C4-type zinc finger protein [Pseudonocardiaceae bacterium]|jgi:ATP-dependent Clp protease ATP-binding subunit ClpX|nr:ClpX C4-type zinc finger protein [Pseudonocardiaceae bacterium]